MKEGEDREKSLLNYSEACAIFEDFQDEKHIGICYANIGAILMQKNEY